jgi:Fic family protein
MDPAIERVIEYIERYSAAAGRLRTRLEAQQVWNSEDIGRLRAGATLSESVKATRSADRRRDLTRIMDDFETSRREIRAAVVAAALAEGMTTTEIADIFGVSRQLANRFVRDAHSLGFLTEVTEAPG